MRNRVRKKTESQAVKDRRLGLLLMIPVVIVVFVIMGLPFIRAIYWSFTDKVIGAEANFIGLDNYIELFSDKIYWKSLTNTLIYTVLCIGAKLLIGLLWAVLLNQNFKGKGFFRTALLIPWALPGMVAAMTWRWMYDSTYDMAFIQNSFGRALSVASSVIPILIIMMLVFSRFAKKDE